MAVFPQEADTVFCRQKRWKVAEIVDEEEIQRNVLNSRPSTGAPR
jgi:hypothetical protein